MAKQVMTFHVNGETIQRAASPTKTLLEVLREELDLTGTTGTSVSGTGPNNGVIGTHTGVFGAGVFGQSSSGSGVHGSSSGTGVAGGSSSGDGVLGESDSGTGIHGVTTGTGLAGLFDGNVQVNGNFSATDTKSFVQAHPTDPSREIVYVALEGGEAGTYVRGTGQQQRQGGAGVAGAFRVRHCPHDLAVQLTPRGAWLQLYVVELDPAQLVVREAQGKSGAFDDLIHGVRRGYEQHEVIRPKR